MRAGFDEHAMLQTNIRSAQIFGDRNIVRLIREGDPRGLLRAIVEDDLLRQTPAQHVFKKDSRGLHVCGETVDVSGTPQTDATIGISRSWILQRGLEFCRRVIPLRCIIDFYIVLIRIDETKRRAMPDIIFLPAFAQAGFCSSRQLKRMMFVIIPAPQIDRIADDLVVLIATNDLFGAIDLKIFEAVDAEIFQQPIHVRPAKVRIRHVERLLEPHRGFAPTFLLIASIRVFALNWENIWPDRRVTQHLNNIFAAADFFCE